MSFSIKGNAFIFCHSQDGKKLSLLIENRPIPLTIFCKGESWNLEAGCGKEDLTPKFFRGVKYKDKKNNDIS